MLTPEYLAGLPDEMVALYGEAERDILADMARRIATYDYWIPAADWQYRKLREAGVCREEILRILSGLTGRTEAELEALIQKAATEALKSDAKVYADLGYDVTDWRMSQALIEILNDGFAATLGELRNLTRTTAVNAAQQFAAALDKAWMKVQTGTFDLNRAVRDAVKELSAAGVSAAKYASGRTDTLEVAVRRAVVTGINQCAGRLQLELAQQLGCRFMEITAHADARPSHALWQGQIVSLDGREGYLTLDDVGYGKIDGIFGVNCRHGWGPWDEGAERVWSEEKLRELNEPKYEYNGQKLTAYEASQTQRKIERNIRRWKRENAAMKAAGQDTTESAVKLRQWQETQKDFLNQTGLKRQSAREQVDGFGRSEASAAGAAAREYYDVWSKSMNINDSIKTLANYYEVKYTDSPRYELLRRYVHSVDSGRLSPLAGFGLYEQYYNKIETELVGMTVGGVKITGQSQHFLERVFGCMQDPKTGKSRDGVALDDVLDCVKNPVDTRPIRVDTNGERSFVVIGRGVIVSVNPDTGRLIQTNEWR